MILPSPHQDALPVGSDGKLLEARSRALRIP